MGSERVEAVLDSMAAEALRIADLIVVETRAAGDEPDPEGLWAATLKAIFHVGVAVGTSDVGPVVLAALAVINPVDQSEGVAEFREALAIGEGPVQVSIPDFSTANLERNADLWDQMRPLDTETLLRVIAAIDDVHRMGLP